MLPHPRQHLLDLHADPAGEIRIVLQLTDDADVDLRRQMCSPIDLSSLPNVSGMLRAIWS